MKHYWNNLHRIPSKTGKQEELKVFVDKKKEKRKKKKEVKVPKQDAQNLLYSPLYKSCIFRLKVG